MKPALRELGDGAAFVSANRPLTPRRRPLKLVALTLPLGLVAALALQASGIMGEAPIAQRPAGNLAGDANLRKQAGLTPANLLDERAPSLGEAVAIKFSGSEGHRENAADCLAAAAWYESGDDPTGQRAVIQTVLNRVRHPAFPKSVCGVVFQGSQLPTGCQFTFTCDGSLAARRPSARAWEAARAIALRALDGFVDQSVGAATHYHADYVSPWWSEKLERLTAVGPHIFYRWPDRRGTLPQTLQLGPEPEYRELVKLSNVNAGTTGEDAAAIVTDHDFRKETKAPELTAASMPQVVGNAEFMVVEDRKSSGRWAITAIKSCGGRRDCHILGYGNSEVVQVNRARAPGTRERPLFLFIRDKASGMELALWDCTEIPRPSQNQCLPESNSALASLLADR